MKIYIAYFMIEFKRKERKSDDVNKMLHLF